MDISQIRGIVHFAVALLNLILAFLLWVKGKSKTTFHLGWVAFFSAVYAFTYWGMFFLESNKLFWVRATWLGVLILPAYLTFVYYFIERTKYLKLKSFLWYLGAVILSYFALATPYIEKRLYPKYPYIAPEEYGALAPFGRVYIIICLIVSLYCLFKEYFKSQGFRKLQLKYFILGAGAYTVGGVFTAGIIPLFYSAFTYIDISAFLSIFWVGLTTYAILKKELFEIKIILTELLVGVFGILLFIQIFLSDSVLEYIWNIIIFVTFLFFGYLLIKSILKEIKIRQKIGEASWKVLEQGKIVSENFKKVMINRERLFKEWFLSDVNKELEINALKDRVQELEKKLKEKDQ